MISYKCKMCGGTLSIQEGMTVCECEYCGSTQTVPQLDDEKKINLFTRANRLRSNCEFDKASGVYESIIAEFPEEAEAYWGVLLCKYGIEYVDDPQTGRKIPTCHRSSFDSIMDDQNFDMIMEYSDPSSRAVYREEAKTIEKLRVRIIEVSSKEEPYDIFICYKETDSIGERTIDSVIAQDVYDALVEKGYRVFFARITLEDRLGQEYEPYIFAALNSAKVMLVFGTDYEYFNAIWVKNEWSRFLSLIEKGEKKTLIPCYKGIDAYDMPKEFARLQAQDMGKVGAIQDLLRGIGKILGDKSAGPASGVGNGNTGSAVLIKRGNMALEDGDFEKADNYFEKALDVNPSEARAYLGKFLASYKLASLADLDGKVFAFDDIKEFRRAEQFADPVLANELRGVRDRNELMLKRQVLLRVIRKVTETKAVQESMQIIAQCTEEAYNRVLHMFDTLTESKCIAVSKARYYKMEAESQFFALNYLKSNLEECSSFTIVSAARTAHILFITKALDKLVAAGLLEKRGVKYSWPGAKEEKERRQREDEELRQKQLQRKAAYDEECARINTQMQNEISVATESISEQYDLKLREIQREMDAAIEATIRNRNLIQLQIDDLRRRQASLSFFKAKEKKTLQSQIDDAQSDLNRIPSQQEIQSGYQPQINQISSERGEAINRVKIEIQSRYELPKLEDFG